jgi:hypothetical protein
VEAEVGWEEDIWEFFELTLQLLYKTKIKRLFKQMKKLYKQIKKPTKTNPLEKLDFAH